MDCERTRQAGTPRPSPSSSSSCWPLATSPEAIFLFSTYQVREVLDFRDADSIPLDSAWRRGSGLSPESKGASRRSSGRRESPVEFLSRRLASSRTRVKMVRPACWCLCPFLPSKIFRGFRAVIPMLFSVSAAAATNHNSSKRPALRCLCLS